MTSSAELLNHIPDLEVREDSLSRTIWSVDASIYEVLPRAVVIPKTKQALIAACRTALAHGVPITPRGAATGVTGGCLGEGWILDCSRWLRSMGELDQAHHTIRVEPGVIQDTLNERLSPYGRRLGPDTSTGNRATIGGMYANNSAGARSLRYGSMAQHTTEIELLTLNGELLRFGRTSLAEAEAIASGNDPRSRIYRGLLELRDTYADAIRRDFPKIPRRVSGYNLPALLHEEGFNVAELLAGSEGTLGVITELTVSTALKPSNTGLALISFDHLSDAFDSVGDILPWNPLSLELIDDKILEAGRRSPALRARMQWLQGIPKALLAVEFDHPQLEAELQSFLQEMRQHGHGLTHDLLTDPAQMNDLWAVRKSGLGLLLSKRSYSRAIAFLEDFSLPPDQLASFMKEFEALLVSHNKEAGIYGHAGAGCLHVRPYIDLRSSEELTLMQTLMHKTTALLKHYGGSLSGEHGDGRIRSWLLPELYSPEILQAFQKLKQLFDPHNRFNPGKIVDATPVDQHLRLGPQTQIHSIETRFDFSREGGLSLAADLCNGNGLCRKSTSLMCPSYQATQDEMDTTRARAQALRSLINGRQPDNAATREEIHDVLKLCLQCKGCKKECPSQVDMAKMKSEMLYQYYQKNRPPFREKLLGHIAHINSIGSYAPWLFNFLASNPITRALQPLLGIAKERSLPRLATQCFSEWLRLHPGNSSPRQVVLFNDTFTEFNHPEIGIAAVQILRRLGYEVIVPPWRCCGRPLISKGFLDQAHASGVQLLESLKLYSHLPIIALEPSCLYALRDDLQDLIPDFRAIQRNFISLERFLLDHHPSVFVSQAPTRVLIHRHCHEKSCEEHPASLPLLRQIKGLEVSEIPSGCCGMAGSFGFEKEHSPLSIKIGELTLFPIVRDADPETILIANGTSCRTQIQDGTKHTAMHMAEFLYRLMSR